MTDYDALERRLLEDCYCGGDNNLSGVDCVPCRAAAAIRELRAERDALKEQVVLFGAWQKRDIAQADAIRELRAERDRPKSLKLANAEYRIQVLESELSMLRSKLESSQLQCREAWAVAERNNALVNELMEQRANDAYDAAMKEKP